MRVSSIFGRTNYERDCLYFGPTDQETKIKLYFEYYHSNNKNSPAVGNWQKYNQQPNDFMYFELSGTKQQIYEKVNNIHKCLSKRFAVDKARPLRWINNILWASSPFELADLEKIVGTKAIFVRGKDEDINWDSGMLNIDDYYISDKKILGSCCITIPFDP